MCVVEKWRKEQGESERGGVVGAGCVSVFIPKKDRMQGSWFLEP
jgi:hypothetical protein